MKTKKYADGGNVERTMDYDKIKSYSLDDIKGFFRGREAPKEIKRETEEERELAREARTAVPGMGAEVGQRIPTQPVTSAPIPARTRRTAPAPRPSVPPMSGGGMTEEDIMQASRAAGAPSRRIGRGRENESALMRRLRRAVHGEDYAREIESQNLYAKGGSVKKMASGGTCRGMGKATRGGDYKFR